GKVDAPGWRLFGEVAPEPSAADLRELVRLEAVRNRDDFRETMARMGITDQDLAQWPEGRAELGIHDVPNIIAAKRLGWDSSKMSFEAWGG
ncbi:MAG: hypothetical protein GWN58_16380, partial [Anaerolineae bacterium]|nr:hypothetical protein [Anaerolineae bacterium]